MKFKNWEVGDYVTEIDIQSWAEWEAQFFDLESALVMASVKSGNAAPDEVAKKKKLKKVPITVKAVRSGALSQMKGLDKLLVNSITMGLISFVVADDQKWTGLAWGLVFPRTLVVSMDQASTGFAAIWFLNYHLGMRVIAIYDPYHREWNDTKLAISDENLWWVILMSTVVYNMPHGPWASCSFWSKMVDMAKVYAERGSWTGQLFSILYDKIAVDLSQVAIGSAAHKKIIFDTSLRMTCSKRKGRRLL